MLFSLIACHPQKKLETGFSQAPVSGLIGNNPFHYAESFAEIFEQRIHITILGIGQDNTSAGSEVFFSVPVQEGSYSQKFHNNKSCSDLITLYERTKSTNHWAKTSVIEIQQIDTHSVRGKISAISDEFNYISGTFIASITHTPTHNI